MHGIDAVRGGGDDVFEARLTKDDEHRAQVLELEGNFTLDEKRRVDDLIPELTSCEYAGVVLDISKIKFIDSAGLMVVLSIFNKLMRSDKSMVVATGGNPYAEGKLKEIGLLRIPHFQAFEAAEEAKRALTRSRT
jgi:anti-anti-sigma factor